jgi:hypothetical protein
VSDNFSAGGLDEKAELFDRRLRVQAVLAAMEVDGDEISLFLCGGGGMEAVVVDVSRGAAAAAKGYFTTGRDGSLRNSGCLSII